jgi:WD40 repeat protein/DNA-binding SARP family transcriptional activator
MKLADLEGFLLGSFQLMIDQQPVTRFESNKVRALLAYLLVEAERIHSRDMLATLLWPDLPQRNARNNLRYALADLRQNIQDSKYAFLSITRETIQFKRTSDYWLDVAVFSQIVEATSRKIITSNSVSGAIDELIGVIHLYRGNFMEGFAVRESPLFDEWLLLKRERYARQMSHGLQILAEYYEQCGEISKALIYARQQVEIEPWNEESHQRIMRLLVMDGQSSSALAQYETCRRMLADELGVNPSETTISLYNKILDERASRDVSNCSLTTNRDPSPGESPYKGLQYFEPCDANIFFGRETITATIINHVREMLKSTTDYVALRFLALVGASGSGKSSILRAGMVPAIYSTRFFTSTNSSSQERIDWEVHIITPTSHPLEVLNSLEHRSAPYRLLIVDQLEELFTICLSEDERKAFLTQLVTFAEPENNTIVIIALRADFYTHCARYPNLRNAIAARQVYIGAMDIIELQRAIERPALQAGWGFEPGLVDWILRDIGEEPGVLPLLSHALLETWHKREGKLLTSKGYLATGGVGGAIAKTAETFYSNLPASQKRLARNIFLRLTNLGDHTQETRHRATFEELITHPSEAPRVHHLLSQLADARLVTLSYGSVEVAHEALIREWPTLRGWLDEDQAGMRIRHHISMAAQTWQDFERDTAELYRGKRLIQALQWASHPEHSDVLNSLEKTFLSVSQAETQRQEGERKAVQRRLNKAYQIARADELTSAALSQMEVDPERSMLLALESLKINETSRGVNALHQAFASMRIWLTLSAHKDTISTLAFNKEGTLLASAGKDHCVKIWDFSWLEQYIDNPSPLASPRLCLQLEYPVGFGCVTFIPSRASVAVACDDDITRIWDIQTSQLLTNLPGSLLACNSAGDQLAIVSNDTLAMWNIGEEVKQWEIPLSQRTVYKTLAYSPDNRFLASGYPDGSVQIWDAYSGKRRLTFRSSSNSIWSLTFNPSSEFLAIANGNGGIHVHDISTGELLLSMLGRHNAGPKGLAYTPDGKWLISSAQDGKAKVWDAATGEELYTLHGHNQAIDSMALHPSGSWLATGARDGTMRLWNLTSSGNRELFTKYLGDPSPVIAGAFSLDWYNFAIVDEDLNVRIHDAETFQTKTTFPIDHIAEKVYLSEDANLLGIAGISDYSIWETCSGKKVFSKPYRGSEFALCINSDGTRVLHENGENTAVIVDVSDGHVQFYLSGHTQLIKGGAFSPDGCLIATASDDKTARIWNASDGRLLSILVGHSQPLVYVAFSPDSQQIVTSSQDGTLRLWDSFTGECLQILAEHTATVRGAFFCPDGKHLASYGYDGKVIVWDTTSWSSEHTFSINGLIFGIGFNPDGKHLFVVFSDQTIHYYSICTKELREMAHKRLTRSWTVQERKHYQIG